MGEVIKRMKGGRFIGWYVRWIDGDGKRKQRASHQPTAVLARKLLVELEAKAARGRLGAPEAAEQLTLTELFERFCLDYSAPRLKDVAKYREKSRSCLRRIERHVPRALLDIPLHELKPFHIGRIRDALSRRYPAGGTVRTSMIALSAALSWAKREDWIEHNPARGVEQPPPPPHSDEFLEPDEIRRLLETAKAWSSRGLKWQGRYVAVALGLYLGLRRGEIFGLRWRDISFETGRLSVRHSYDSTPKSGKARHLKMPEQLVPILAEWRAVCPRTDQLLVCPVWCRGVWGLSTNTAAPRGLDKLLRAAGCRVIGRCWHLLRHSFASAYLRAGGNVTVLQRILGHASIRTTMVYSHHSADFLDSEMSRVRY